MGVCSKSLMSQGEKKNIFSSPISRLTAATPITMDGRTKGKAAAGHLIKVVCEMTAFRNEDSETPGKLGYYAKSDEERRW